ncbi:LysM domain-containing protein [Clostridium aceticum]|uniref:LysM domain-containing protein n=1 Tax=Clostridium aceticum TaxID=84022 RepID=A0A0D8I819_9CLOT|nr:SPOCS domain-containing protein [Clostridium aceticum]AKL97138.1 LysM domain-containing protein [Clostridium aceticum]KJF26182.1 peptidoglycan-binding protein [Clostridium aceticum]
MAIELMKDLLKIDQLVGENTVQAIIEGDILAPDIKPDISRVVAVEGNIQVTKQEAQENKILVEGRIQFKVLYVSEKGEAPLYSIDSSTDFKQNIELEGLTSQMKSEVIAEIEHIDYTLNNERKIGVKAVINVEGKGKQEGHIEITKDLEGMEDIEVLKETLQYTDVIGSNSSDTLVKDAFELEKDLPEVKEVLKWQAVAIEKETKITDGKVIVGGNVLLEVLYIGEEEENSLNIVKKEIPFTHFIEVPEAYSDMEYKLKMKVDEVYTDIKENAEEERRILEVEGIVNIEAVVMENQKREVVVDAYSPTQALNLEKSKLQLKEHLGIHRSQVLLRETLELPSSHPPMAQVFSISAKPIVTDYNIVDHKVMMEGVLETTVIYTSEEGLQPIYSYMQEIPFRNHMEIEGLKGNMDADVEFVVQDLDYNTINEEQIEIKINIGTTCQAYCIKNIDVVANVEELEELVDVTKRPSLTIYFFQEGDSLWKIAKKYNTTVQHIMESNEIEKPEDIKAGDEIIIEKVYNFKF